MFANYVLSFRNILLIQKGPYQIAYRCQWTKPAICVNIPVT